MMDEDAAWIAELENAIRSDDYHSSLNNSLDDEALAPPFKCQNDDAPPGGPDSSSVQSQAHQQQAPSSRSSPQQRKKRNSYSHLIDSSLPPEEVRRRRRIISNRESARRVKERRDQEIVDLRTELGDVQRQLEASNRQNDIFKIQIGFLQEQLKDFVNLNSLFLPIEHPISMELEEEQQQQQQC
jgi:hypothetical protein